MSPPHSLPQWGIFESIATTGAGPEWFGFVKDWKTINRLNARYRLAKSCAGLSTTGYSKPTSAGYDALTRAFLAWSAFEMLCRAKGLHSDTHMAATLDRNGAEALLAKVANTREYKTFFHGIREEINSAKQRAAIDNYLAGEPADAGKVISSIRHIFAHGLLTPNIGGTDPTESANIANQIADFLVRTVESEWTASIEEGEVEWDELWEELQNADDY